MTNPRWSYFVLLETTSGDYTAASGCFKMKEKNFIPVTNQVAESISVHMVKKQPPHNKAATVQAFRTMGAKASAVIWFSHEITLLKLCCLCFVFKDNYIQLFHLLLGMFRVSDKSARVP